MGKDIDLEKLYKIVLEKCQKDLDLMKKINVHPKIKEGSFPVKTNKLVEILEGTLSFLKDKNGNDFYNLFDGKIAKEFDVFDNSPGRTTVLGEDFDGLGNSRGTFLKSVIIFIYLQMKKQALSQVSASQLGINAKGSFVDHFSYGSDLSSAQYN